jgi:hypothetical protein
MAKLVIRWNKDLSISIYYRGKLVQKFTGSYARASADAFIDGWFQDKERKVAWVYA